MRIPGKVTRSQSMSTVFEEPMDFDQLGARVPATSSKHGTGDASKKFKEDHTVPRPSSAGQHGQVISPQIQGSPHPSRSSQGDLGSSTSPQDAQGLSLSTQEVLELTKCFQEYMGHSTSAQASQRLPTCAERKIIHASSSRRSSKRLSSTLHVTSLSNSPPKHVGQDSSGQGDLQQVPSDKEGSKPPSPKGNVSDFSFVPNVSSPTSSPQESSTCLTAAKAGNRAKPSHKDSQRCFPSPPKCPMQSASSKCRVRSRPARTTRPPVLLNSSLFSPDSSCLYLPRTLGRSLLLYSLSSTHRRPRPLASHKASANQGSRGKSPPNWIHLYPGTPAQHSRCLCLI